MRNKLFVGAFFVLAACAGQNADPQKAVFDIRGGYVALLAAATNYESLPRCDETTSKVCSDRAIVEEIRKADDNAHSALDVAEEFVRKHPDLDASDAIEGAQKAIAVLSKILASYNIKVGA